MYYVVYGQQLDKTHSGLKYFHNKFSKFECFMSFFLKTVVYKPRPLANALQKQDSKITMGSGLLILKIHERILLKMTIYKYN